MEPSPSPRERLPRSLLFLYGAPSFAGAAMLVPIYIHLPKFYSDGVGVSLGYLAIAIAAARALAFFFHLVRLHAARRLLRRDVAPAVIAAWLDGDTEAPALAPFVTQPLS